MGVYQLKETRHGWMLYNPLDKYVGRSLHCYGEFSPGEVEMFDALIQPGHVVIDAGANIGAHTVWFARRARFVFAFEPQRILFQVLCANIAMNEFMNVQTYQMALGEAPGEVRVPVLDVTVENNFGGLCAKGHDEGEPVGLMALDQMSLPRLDFIKIDVEGMELDVLKGAVNQIERHRPVLYVENDRKENSEELKDFIAGLGYAVEEHTTRLFSPENHNNNVENIFGDAASFNLICYSL